jgi:hypothetical protein
MFLPRWTHSSILKTEAAGFCETFDICIPNYTASHYRKLLINLRRHEKLGFYARAVVCDGEGQLSACQAQRLLFIIFLGLKQLVLPNT